MLTVRNLLYSGTGKSTGWTGGVVCNLLGQVAQQFRARMDVQFRENVPDMELDGAFADAEERSDFFVG